MFTKALPRQPWHICQDRQRVKDYIHVVQPKLARYTELVQEIQGKSKDRKALLAEKKETLFYLIPKQHELSRRIAELTEKLEELKSEKDMPRSLECADDADPLNEEAVSQSVWKLLPEAQQKQAKKESGVSLER